MDTCFDKLKIAGICICMAVVNLCSFMKKNNDTDVVKEEPVNKNVHILPNKPFEEPPTRCGCIML